MLRISPWACVSHPYFYQCPPAAAERDLSYVAARGLEKHGLNGDLCAVPPRAGEPGLDDRASGLHNEGTGRMVESVVGDFKFCK